jgi:hypothetical protein
MDLDAQVRTAIYWYTSLMGVPPRIAKVASLVKVTREEVRQSYARLYKSRVLVIDPDGETIRMAPPFSGVETQHRVLIGKKEYHANCSWDALGIPAALHADAEVVSRCEQSLERIVLHVGENGPEPQPCVAHFAVRAAHWWRDIVYT